MTAHLRTIGGCVLALIWAVSLAWAGEVLIDDYEHGLAAPWEEKSFKGRTEYSVTREDGRLCIKAVSRASASGLYYKKKFRLTDYPILSWTWKVDHTLRKGDARFKAGDDYAARVYLVFPSFFPWKTRALNYIWANKLPKGEAAPNAYASKNVMMFAVESGSDLTGQWIEETRNVLEDYRRYFGGEPPDVGAIAIMTDTDDTGEETTAWYGPISIRSEP